MFCGVYVKLIHEEGEHVVSFKCIPCIYLKIEAKTLNCNSLGVYTKTGQRCFLTTLQNSYTIFLTIHTCRFYRNLLCFANHHIWPNLCNNIAILSCTGTVSLKYVSSFLKYGPNLSHKKYTCIVFHLSSLPKRFLYSQTQQHSLHKFVHPFLTPHTPLFMPHTLINQTQNCKLLPFFVQKKYLNDSPQYASQACTKICIILRAK